MNTEKESKTELVKQALLQDIRQGLFAPGDALPPVLALSRRFRVSKHTISQALSNLNELNIIEVAHGRKTRVRQNVGEQIVKVYFCGASSPHLEPFWAEFYRGITDEFARHSGYRMQLAITVSFDDVDPGELSVLGGALLVGAKYEWLADAFRRKSIPSINIYDYDEQNSENFVTSDLDRPYMELFAHFQKQGRKRALFINQFLAADTHGINEYKRCAMLRAAAENNIKITELPGCDSIYPMAYARDVFKDLYRRKQLPDAIVLGSDNFAPGIYRAAYELKINIPRDIAVCGCNALAASEFMTPQLSSIDLARYEQGRLACASLFELMDSRKASGVKIKLPGKLLLRESC